MKPHALVIVLAIIAGCGKAGKGEYSVPGLIKSLQSENADARYTAAKTLGSYGSTDDGVLPALCEALKDRDATVRLGVVYAFAEIGPKAAPALPQLQTALRQDADKDVRVGAAIALGMFGADGRDALPALQEAARVDTDPDVRAEAQKSAQAIQSKIPGLTRP